jgi:hypothetical protein
VRADGFSARWTRYIDVAAGIYRFTATSDDGIRVFVDGQRLIDEWTDHSIHTYVADTNLSAGHHLVEVEYYENTGYAVAMLSWEPVKVKPIMWRGAYYANRRLSGTPSMVRNDADIDFQWGYGSPAPGIPVDGFSARWTQTPNLEGGLYCFTATSDDGIRVYVDGRRIIDQWHDHPARTYVAAVQLAAGRHDLAVEFYENKGHATARVSWERVQGTPMRWQGEYYANRWLSGSPTIVRSDARIDFQWDYGAPAAGIPPDGFSVRWTRTLGFQPGRYRFTTTTDDGVRLWVNGHLLIDRWHDQSATAYSGTIYLPGDAQVRMEYYENGGVARAQLAWKAVDGNEEPPGLDTVIVDNQSPGFRRGGASAAWRSAAEGYDGHLIWTWNNDRIRSNYNWARWYPGLDRARYEVMVYVPDRYTTTARARYWVSHQGGYTLRVVNQGANSGRWVSLGTYRFSGTRADYVSLADVTYEPYLSRTIAFDAVKWIPR